MHVTQSRSKQGGTTLKYASFVGRFFMGGEVYAEESGTKV